MSTSPKKITTVEQLNSYSKDYDESGFWSVVAKVSPALARTALELYYVLNEDSTPIGVKATIVGALGYLICPIDFIPDIIPILGFTDDAGALALAYKTVKAYVTPAITEKVDRKIGMSNGKRISQY